VNLSILIRDLLLRHEQVVIPGFGIFRIVLRPAQIRRSSRTLLPPAREIVFDNQHRTEDTRLILAIRRKDNLTETEAAEILRKFVAGLEKELHEKRQTELEGLGQLSVDNAGRFQFKPVEDLVEFTGIFALPHLELTPAPAAESGSRPSEPGPVTQVEKNTNGSRMRRWWPVVVIGLLAAIGITIYLSGISRSYRKAGDMTEVTDSADTGRIVFGAPPEHDSLTEAISRKLDEETSRQGLLPEAKTDTQVAPEPVSVTPPEPVDQRPAVLPGGLFHIITGAFSVPENAEKQAADLKSRGYHPTLLPKRGKFYMVSLGSYPSQSEAASALEKFRQELDMDLWVKKIQ
jgi:nucleoid DNA-binding protein